jgi:hypothetical protein
MRANTNICHSGAAAKRLNPESRRERWIPGSHALIRSRVNPTSVRAPRNDCGGNALISLSELQLLKKKPRRSAGAFVRAAIAIAGKCG